MASLSHLLGSLLHVLFRAEGFFRLFLVSWLPGFLYLNVVEVGEVGVPIKYTPLKQKV